MDPTLKAGLIAYRASLKARLSELHSLTDQAYLRMKEERQTLLVEVENINKRLTELRALMKESRRAAKVEAGSEIGKLMREIVHVTALLGDKEEE